MRYTTISALLLILVLSVTVSAQTFRGTILGTVSDPNGAVVPAARVTAKNTNTGLERSTTTDEAGNYTIAELPIGPYEVRVEQTGFANATVSNVAVEVAVERRVDVVLSVAGGENVACARAGDIGGTGHGERRRREPSAGRRAGDGGRTGSGGVSARSGTNSQFERNDAGGSNPTNGGHSGALGNRPR